MADRVSPGRTVHVPAGRAARRAVTSVIAAGADALVRTARVLLATLVAVLLVAGWPGLGWAGRSGPRVPAIAVMASRHQASTRQAGMIRLRTMVLLPSLGIGAGHQRPGAGRQKGLEEGRN
jgi:hypothetical protein